MEAEVPSSPVSLNLLSTNPQSWLFTHQFVVCARYSLYGEESKVNFLAHTLAPQFTLPWLLSGYTILAWLVHITGWLKRLSSDRQKLRACQRQDQELPQPLPPLSLSMCCANTLKSWNRDQHLENYHAFKPSLCSPSMQRTLTVYLLCVQEHMGLGCPHHMVCTGKGSRMWSIARQHRDPHHLPEP